MNKTALWGFMSCNPTYRLVKKGDRVYRGQDLVVIESMKMESGVSSPCERVGENVIATVGKSVETDEVLITFIT